MQTLAQFVWAPRVQTQSAGSRLSAVSMIFILTVSLISVTVDNATDFQVSFLFSRKSQSTKVFYKEEGQPWSGNNFLFSLDRFKDEIECDRIVLRAFLTPHLVATFRASKPDYLHQLLQEAEGNGEGPDGGGLGRKSFSSGTKISAQVGMTSNSFAGSSHLPVSCSLITFFVDVTQNLNLFVVFIKRKTRRRRSICYSELSETVKF